MNRGSITYQSLENFKPTKCNGDLESKIASKDIRKIVGSTKFVEEKFEMCSVLTFAIFSYINKCSMVQIDDP